MNAERQQPIVFAAERLCLALAVAPNCGIRVKYNFSFREDSCREVVEKKGQIGVPKPLLLNK
jgi:hypothetical protein